jgi:hypothetical protein
MTVTVSVFAPAGSQTLEMAHLTAVAATLAEVSAKLGAKPEATNLDGTGSCSFVWNLPSGRYQYTIKRATVAEVRAAYDKNYVPDFERPKAKVDPETLVGRYTVEFEGGTYETIRLKLGKSGHFSGKLVAEYLSGPDNDADYIGFGHVDENGSFRVWSRFVNLRGSDKELAVKAVIGDPEGRADAAEAYARRSGNCSRCGRTLTVPASLNRGYGPECAKKIEG